MVLKWENHVCFEVIMQLGLWLWWTMVQKKICQKQGNHFSILCPSPGKYGPETRNVRHGQFVWGSSKRCESYEFLSNLRGSHNFIDDRYLIILCVFMYIIYIYIIDICIHIYIYILLIYIYIHMRCVCAWVLDFQLFYLFGVAIFAHTHHRHGHRVPRASKF